MLEQLPLLDGGIQLQRLAMSKRQAEIFEEMEIDDEDVEENYRYFGNLDVSPDQHLDYIFSGGQKDSSRFTDGSIPVLYTALETTTALAEKAHWLPMISAQPVIYQFLYIDFHGAYKNLNALDPVPACLTGGRETGAYDLCIAVTREAIKEELDGFQTPSARNPGGVCCPVLSRPAVRQMVLQGYVRFDYDNATATWRSRIL